MVCMKDAAPKINAISSQRRSSSRILELFLFVMICVSPLISAPECNAWTFDAVNWLRQSSCLPSMDLSPSKPLSFPAGLSDSGISDIQTIPLSYDLFRDALPQIPKLRLGYLYTFGKDLRWGRMTGDFFAPVGLSSTSTAFGQFHVEFQDYWQIPFGGAHHRVDLSAGGGFRKLVNNNLMLGVNAFYDSTRIFSKWYASAGAGAEVAFQLPNHDVVDFTYNYYGNLSRGNQRSDGEIVNGPPNMDFEIGYSHAVLGNTPDLRARLNAYNYDTTQNMWGFKGGADLSAFNGALTLRAEIGRDQLYGSYQTLGAFVNIPVRLDNIFTFNSPFVFAGGPSSGTPQGIAGGSSGRSNPQEGSAEGYMYPYGAHPHMSSQDAVPVPIYMQPQNLVSFLTEPVRRQFASHAVSVTENEPDEVVAAPKMFVASGDANVVFTLNPKYTATSLDNIKPTSLSITATVTSRGPVNITGMQLHIKDTRTVWVLYMPDWTTSMGLYYKYDLTSVEIEELWRVLTESPERSIYEVRFNQLTGMNLRDLEIAVTIKQDIPKPVR